MNLQCSAICSGAWLISSCSSQGVTTFEPSRELGRGKRLYGEMHGRTFKNSTWQDDKANRAAWDREALIRGYAEQHFRANTAFISLKLSPRCRREARSILGRHGERSALEFCRAVCGREIDNQWWNAVLDAPYMANRRREYVQYIATGVGSAYDNPKTAQKAAA
jgi:hypothetical protein